MDQNIASQGLTSSQAEAKLIQNGTNEVTNTEKTSIIYSFFSQFNNFLTILLIAAAVISALLGEYIDSFFIIGIVILNALFGLYQEFKAEKALESLKKMTVSTIRVIRDGKETQVDSKNLVVDDIIYIEEGTKIPADGILIKSWHLEINEAALTGESLPVAKIESDKDNNSLFAGTVVSRGRAYAKITATGGDTKFGKIASTLSTIQKVKTPLQKKLEILTKQIGLIGMGASILVFIISIINGKLMFDSFFLAVSLAVAAVPEGLPAVMTITLAIGVEQMAKRKAIIRRLNAIETLGSVTVVATDKTGTLTTNQMTVKHCWIHKDISKMKDIQDSVEGKLLLRNSVLCSTASVVYKVDHDSYDCVGDPTEGALLIMAHKNDLDPDLLRADYTIIDEKSFDAVTKRMSVHVKHKRRPNDEYIFTKGAPESILDICDYMQNGESIESLIREKKQDIRTTFQSYAKKGLRMIAFSYKKPDKSAWEDKQIFLGFVGIADPVRPEIIEAVKKAKEAGIRIVMVTGDNPLTAEAVGIETGIITEGEDILTGAQLEQYSDEELKSILPKVKIFARSAPEHKYRLVQLYQSMGEVVAVTGDGVNDALALKQADVGVAMGITGTDVAKETADMIITDDNFASLINAIEYGRDIFNHIKNAIKYLLSCNAGEVVYILFAVLMKVPVLTPLQILYINLATDGLPAIALAFSPKNKDVMKQKPRRALTILNKIDFQYIFFIGLVTAICGAISLLSYLPLNPEDGLTSLFITIVLIQPVIFIDIWISHKPLLKHLKLLVHPMFFLAFGLPFIIQPILIYHPFLQSIFTTTPLPINEYVLAIVSALLILIPIEITKITKLLKSNHKD